MTYQLNRTDGTFIGNVPDGALRTDLAPLTMIGRGTLAFGDAFNENMIKLLENFSNTSAPNLPMKGMLWFDVANERLKIYLGPTVGWRDISMSYTGNIILEDANGRNSLFASGIIDLYRPDGTARVQFRNISSGSPQATLQQDGTNLKLIGGNFRVGTYEVWHAGNLNPLSRTGGDMTGPIILSNGTDQTIIGNDGHIELCQVAGHPYIDFKDSIAEDFDVRLLRNAGTLSVVNAAANGYLSIDGSGAITLSKTSGTPVINFRNEATPSSNVALQLGTATDDLRINGYKVWHAGNLNAISSAGGEITGDLLVKDGAGSGVKIFGAGGIDISRVSGTAWIDFKDNLAEDYDLRLSVQTGSSTLYSTGNVMVSAASPCVGIFKTSVGATGFTYIDSSPAIASVDGYGNALAAYCIFSGAGTVFYNNVLATGDITAFSDGRLKSDVSTIEDALDIILNLRGVRYTKDGRRSLGVIAQELQKYVPELVHVSPDGMLSVAYGNMAGLLIEANKTLAAKIDALEDSLAAVLKRLEALEAR